MKRKEKLREVKSAIELIKSDDFEAWFLGFNLLTSILRVPSVTERFHIDPHDYKDIYRDLYLKVLYKHYVRLVLNRRHIKYENFIN